MCDSGSTSSSKICNKKRYLWELSSEDLEAELRLRKERKRLFAANRCCVDQSTCFCLPAKSKQVCRECLGEICPGDCVKLSTSGGRFACIHVQCPGFEKPLIHGFCEKRSKYGKCKCAEAYYRYQCANCGEAIERGHCIPYRPPHKTPVHTLCGVSVDNEAETPKGVADVFSDKRSNTKQSGLKPRSLQPVLDECNVGLQRSSSSTENSAKARLIRVGSIMIHKQMKRYFEILELQVRDDATRQTFAVCNVYVRLQDTTIGKHETERLLSNGYPHQFARLPGQETISLKELHSTDLTAREVQTDFIWEPITKGSEGEHQWTFAYYSDASFTRKLQWYQPPVAMDLFAGAGGVNLGFRKAGLKVKFSLEKDSTASITLRQNSEKDTIIYNEDAYDLLTRLKSGQLLGSNPKPGQIDILHASPPCQGHSSANPNGGLKEEENNNLTLLSIEYVRFIRPKVFTFENVMGIMEKDRRGKSRSSFQLFQEVVAELVLLDYQVRVTAVNAKDFGDPQSRPRVVLIASQKVYDLPTMPKPSHGEGTGKAYVTASVAIGDLESFTPDHRTGAISMGNTILRNHILLGPENQKCVPDYALEYNRRLNAGKPAQTILCSNAVKHYNLERCITPRERARLQGFPDDYLFYGTYLEQCKQIGNAVPIGLAKAIAEAALKCFDFRPSKEYQ